MVLHFVIAGGMFKHKSLAFRNPLKTLSLFLFLVSERRHACIANPSKNNGLAVYV
jgi:hypothetical protein